jgi:hypothetical protein
MPIRPYLDGHRFDSETIRLLGLAFEITRSALNVQEDDEQAKEIIAKELIDLAKQGERDPDRLCEQVLAMISAKPTDERADADHAGTRQLPRPMGSA